MATTTLTLAFKQNCFLATLDFANDTFRWALYNGSGHDASQGTYTATAEVPNGSGYTTAGVAAAGASAGNDAGSNTAWYDFTTDPQWTASTIDATDMMLYDDTSGTDISVGIYDFGGTRSTSSGTFNAILPLPAATTAIVRIA